MHGGGRDRSSCLPALHAMFSSSITDREIHKTDIDLRTFMSLMAMPMMISPRPAPIPFPGRDTAPRSMLRLRA